MEIYRKLMGIFDTLVEVLMMFCAPVIFFGYLRKDHGGLPVEKTWFWLPVSAMIFIYCIRSLLERFGVAKPWLLASGKQLRAIDKQS